MVVVEREEVMSEIFRWIGEPKHNPVPNTGWKTEPEQPAMVQPTEQVTLPGQTAPAPGGGQYTTEAQPAPLPVPGGGGGYTTENQPTPLPVPGAEKAPTPPTTPISPPTCAPGEVLVNGACVPLPKLQPKEPAASTAQTVGYSLGAVALVGATALGIGYVMANVLSAGMSSVSMKANPANASRAHLRPMTKAEAMRLFETYRLPHVIEQYGPMDKPAVREAWVHWVDMLYDDGRITKRQSNSWGSYHGNRY